MARACRRRWLVAVFSAILLTACDIELYSSLDEREANEMLALLLHAGLDAKKVPGKDQVVSLMVKEADAVTAIELLGVHGYPRDKFASIGDVFKQDGFISNPIELKARYIYARSQDIAETLAQIDGVVVARVHVVLGEPGRSGHPGTESSASVFIKYRRSYDLEGYGPQIKAITVNGIEGLNFERVSVAMFPSEETEADGDLSTGSLRPPPGAAPLGSTADIYYLLGALLAAGLLAAAGAWYLWARRRAVPPPSPLSPTPQGP